MLVFVGIAVAFVAFFVVMAPLIFWVNYAIGSSFVREAEQMKASLGARPLAFAEDGMKLRQSAVAPLAFSVTWMLADVRVDGHALYVMRYFRRFGRWVFGQPNLRVTWEKEERVDGFFSAYIEGEPRIEDGAVVIRVRMNVQSISLRLRPREPERLLAAIFAMR